MVGGSFLAMEFHMNKWRICLLVVLVALVGVVSAAPAPPSVAWTDERHALLSWQQQQATDELCIGKVAHGNYVLIGCGPFGAGPQQLRLPPFPSGNDAAVWPHEGDVYLVGDARSAPLGPVPALRLIYAPLVRR